jgi:hypothetical protein
MIINLRGHVFYLHLYELKKISALYNLISIISSRVAFKLVFESIFERNFV